jgi:hypothetical protein
MMRCVVCDRLEVRLTAAGRLSTQEDCHNPHATKHNRHAAQRQVSGRGDTRAQPAAQVVAAVQAAMKGPVETEVAISLATGVDRRASDLQRVWCHANASYRTADAQPCHIVGK